MRDLNLISKTLTRIIVLVIVFGFSIQNVFAAQNYNPNDPNLPQQWWVDTLKLKEAWGYTKGGDVIVAVLDSGIDMDHPDLVEALWKNIDEVPGDNFDNDMNGYIDDVYGYDFVDYDGDINPRASIECFDSKLCDKDAHVHGTLISGLIAARANNGFGVAGVAPEAKIMALRVLSSIGEGQASEVVKAIDYAVANGANIINMSFAGPFEDGNLTAAINRALNAGVAVVVAAGNQEVEGTPINLSNDPRFPICNVTTKHRSIGVASVGQNLILSPFSNYGECVDITAPGDNIIGDVVYDPSLNLNTFINSGFKGTSLSTPIVSGALALLKSYRPDMSMYQITEALLNNVQNNKLLNQGRENDIGRGTLNIMNAVNSLTATKPADPVMAVDPFTQQEVNITPVINPSVAYAGEVVKSSTYSTIYYIGNDGKRYYFPDQSTYFSWYTDFKNVKILSESDLSKYDLGGLVTMRPGVVLLKTAYANKVYAISGKTIHWIQDEGMAIALYGSSWSDRVREVSDVLLANYTLDTDITSSSQYDYTYEMLRARTINELKGL